MGIFNKPLPMPSLLQVNSVDVFIESRNSKIHNRKFELGSDPSSAQRTWEKYKTDPVVVVKKQLAVEIYIPKPFGIALHEMEMVKGVSW